MTESEVMDLLKGVSSNIIVQNIEKLNDIGIVVDIEKPYFPHMIMKNWKMSHEDYLRDFSYSYTGGSLFTLIVMDPENGPTCVLYDTSKYNADGATRYAKNQVAKNIKD